MALVCVDENQLLILQDTVTTQQAQWSLLLDQLNLLQRHINERVPLIPCPCNGCTQADPTAANLINNLINIANQNTVGFTAETQQTTDAVALLDWKLDQCGIPELT